MCPAIHISSRSWLRSSSTHEPSDPPPKVVIVSVFVFRPRESRPEVPTRRGFAGQTRTASRECLLVANRYCDVKGNRKKRQAGRPSLRGPKGSLNLRRGAPARLGTRVYPGGFGAALLLSASPAERTDGPEPLPPQRGEGARHPDGSGTLLVLWSSGGGGPGGRSQALRRFNPLRGQG